MLWIKALHIIFMVTWFSGLFYLPRLFVYHAMTEDNAGIERFKTMEYKLFYFITTPGGVLTTLSGIWLLTYNPAFYLHQGWMHVKLTLILLLWIYHMYCGHLLKKFRHNKNRYSATFYRWFNEFPTLILVGTVICVVVKPYSA